MPSATLDDLKRNYYGSQLGLTQQVAYGMSLQDLELAFFTNPPAAGGSSGGGSSGTAPGVPLLSGESNFDRRQVSLSILLLIGRLRIVTFQAQKTESITQLRVPTGTTAAIGTTSAWLCAYEITNDAGTWNAHLIAVSANDPTLFSIGSTMATATVPIFTKQAGHYYAVSYLLVGTTNAPTTLSIGNLIGAAISNGLAYAGPPILAEVASAAGPPPATIPMTTGASGNTGLHYAEMMP